MKTVIKIKLILLLVVLWSFSVCGATIGTAVLLKGQMKVESADTYRLIDEPNATLEVNESDKIHTGAGPRVKIYLREKKEVIHLYARSFLTMDKVNDEQSDLSLLIGKARFVVEPTINKLTSVRRKFQVRTSNAFIGVRGTDFVVQTDGVSTDVLTVDGVVAVANQADPDVEVEVGQNQASKTSGDAPPTQATDVPEDAVDDITDKDEAGEWEEVEFPETPEATSEEADEPEEETESLAAVDEVQEDVDKATETVTDTTRSSTVKFTVTEE